MNSYDFALQILARTPTQLRTALATIPGDVLEIRPSPDAWSIHQILDHLFQAESGVIAERIRRMVSEDNPTFGSASPFSAPTEAAALLEAWLVAREDSLKMLRSLTTEQLARTGQHPRYGQITVREHVVEWAYHDLDHLRQILAVLQSVLYQDIGVFQALYPKPS